MFFNIIQNVDDYLTASCLVCPLATEDKNKVEAQRILSPAF